VSQPGATEAAAFEVVGVRAGGELLALELARVVEVVRPLAIAELPRVPSYLKGAAQYRSEVIPVIDLAARLGLVVRGETPPLKARLVVVTSVAGRAGLLVDEIVGVWRDGVLEDSHLVRAGDRVPLVDLKRVIDWRAA
jgi:purine-binding chemotaxis protein CheW